jgi:hypothetical protein
MALLSWKGLKMRCNAISSKAQRDYLLLILKALIRQPNSAFKKTKANNKMTKNKKKPTN